MITWISPEILAIGIDEIHWQHAGNFLTLVYQIDPMQKRERFNKTQLTTRKAYGFRSYRCLEIARTKESERSFAAVC